MKSEECFLKEFGYERFEKVVNDVSVKSTIF